VTDVTEADHDIDDTEVAAATPPSADAPTTSARHSTAWIAWTIAVALAVVAAVAVVQWQSVAQPVAAVDAASDAAVDYVVSLSTWDASEGLEPTYAALRAGATDDFAPEIDEVFGDQQREELVAIDAVSTGTINDVLTGRMQRGETTSVQVVVIVDQFVVSGPTADPVARTQRVALLQMVRDGGTWLVNDLEMLSELRLSEEDQ